MAARLKAAGFPEADVRVLVPDGAPKKGNLVARLRGTGAKRPLLLLAHLDVVEASAKDWPADPFVLREQGGYFYGRGTTDDKAMAAIFVANLIRFKQENYRPERDLILALTSDEEGGNWNGVDFLVKNHRALIDAELGINEGGGGQIKDGKRSRTRSRRARRSTSASSSRSRTRAATARCPCRRTPSIGWPRASAAWRSTSSRRTSTKSRAAFFTRCRRDDERRGRSRRDAGRRGAADGRGCRGEAVTAAVLQRAAANDLRRDAAHGRPRRERAAADGARDDQLPRAARRIRGRRPEDAREGARRRQGHGHADQPAEAEPAIAAHAAVMGPVESITQAMWPGVPVVPIMSTGATDALWLRGVADPVYGVDGLYEDIDDIRAHGRDERLGVTSFYEGQEFLYRLVKALASAR
jgi:acetylornithine deacetylase/succinyl-diaminopimelate desuccinylase-like protein